jgi:hypothetical protein
MPSFRWLEPSDQHSGTRRGAIVGSTWTTLAKSAIVYRSSSNVSIIVVEIDILPSHNTFEITIGLLA